MVYILSVGACLSVYFLYKNKHKITFELLRYYTYLDELLTKYGKSEDTKFLYPDNESLLECCSLKSSLINIKDQNFPFIITRDYIVYEEAEKGKKPKSKLFYNFYKISNVDLENENTENEVSENENTENEVFENEVSERNEVKNIIELVNPIKLGINSENYEEELVEKFFKNHMNLISNFNWSPPIIAASLNIIDKNNVYTFREYDITQLLSSIVIEDKVLKLDNEPDTKKLWVYLFNYINKSKNILVPADDYSLENYTLKWTIILDTCEVKEGSELEIVF